MATMTMDVSAIGNNPPSKLGRVTLILDYNELYTFTLADFTTNAIPTFIASDPEGDDLESVRIESLPIVGDLTNNGVPAAINDVITSANITAGHLKYQCDPADTDGYLESFFYTASDLGSSTFSPGDGTVGITVGAQENQAPTEVGDGTMTIDYGETGVFTRAMFTTGTTPAYSDPEGDPALWLKITGLPALGEIQLNGTPVILNEVVDFDDIDAGLLTYVPDLADTDGDMQGFTFEVADVSGIFVA